MNCVFPALSGLFETLWVCRCYPEVSSGAGHFLVPRIRRLFNQGRSPDLPRVPASALTLPPGVISYCWERYIARMHTNTLRLAADLN